MLLLTEYTVRFVSFLAFCNNFIIGFQITPTQTGGDGHLGIWDRLHARAEAAFSQGEDLAKPGQNRSII